MEGAAHEEFVGEAVVPQRGEVEAVVGASLLGEMVVARRVEGLNLRPAAAERLEQAHAGGIVRGLELLEGLFQGEPVGVRRNFLRQEGAAGEEGEGQKNGLSHSRPSLSYLRGVGSVQTTKSADVLLVSDR